MPSPFYMHQPFSFFDYLSFIHSPKLTLKLTFDIKFFLTTSAPNVLPSPRNAHTQICSTPWYLVNSSCFFYEFTSTTKSSLKVERTSFFYERRKCTVEAFKSEKPGFNSQLYHYDSDIFFTSVSLSFSFVKWE